jgi:putative CocE/NonD family hydrolase
MYKIKSGFILIILFYIPLNLANAQSYKLLDNVMVKMRDGVQLATDIYLPANNNSNNTNKYPVIFHRTPYNKIRNAAADAEFFCKHGYVVIFQDCRGRYKSEGVFTKYINEPNDGYDAIAWIAGQSWCNGKIGMRGASYVAHVQAGAAKLNPPNLKTIVVNVGGTSNGWEHAIRNHGAFALKQITWAFSNLRKETDDPVIRMHIEQQSVSDWFAVLPLKKELNPLSVSPEFEDYIFEMMTHGVYDDYWKQMGMNWKEYYVQTSDIPMIHISGWYDNYCQTAIDNYVGLSQIKKSPVHLLMGPWMHGTTNKTFAGNVDFGQEAAIPDFNYEWHLKWYDQFLKGEPNNVDLEHPVKIFVMGTGDGSKNSEGRLNHGGYWIKSKDWPLPNTQFVNYYLHDNGRLSPAVPGSDEKKVSYIFDPQNPCPTIGGSMAASEPLWVGGAYHQCEKEYNGDPTEGYFGSKPPFLPLKTRKDVLVYQTDVLTEDVQVIGPVKVVLHVSSDAPDTDFTAKLVDVYPPSKDFPDGFEMNITDGILRSRFRESPEKEVLMEKGVIYEITIHPFSTANVFKKGHRIRLDISSSNFPRFDVNPNTGEPLGLNTTEQKAENTIYHHKEKASYIVLPLVQIN